MVPTIDIIVILFEIISLMIYLSLVVLFCGQYTKQDKEGMNAFYTTFIIGFCVDLFEIIKSKFIVSFPSFQLFLDFYKTSNIPKYCVPIFGYTVTFAAALGIFCITLNRAIAISFPIFYRFKWSRYTLLITFLIQFLLPILVFYYEFGVEAKLKYDNVTGNYAFGMKDAEVSKKNNTIAPIFSTIILSSQISLSLLSLYKLLIEKVKTKSTLEYKVLYYSVIYSAVATIGISIICLRYWIKFAGVNSSNVYLQNYGQLLGTYSSTVATTCQPYLMLIINVNVRKRYLNFYFKKKKSTVTKTPNSRKKTLT